MSCVCFSSTSHAGNLRAERTNASKLVRTLKRCNDLQTGRELHLEAKGSGLQTDKYVAAALINMYTNCGDMISARNVFDSTAIQDVVTWSCLILGYVKNGQSSTAMELFLAMDCEPNHVTFVAGLKACSGLAAEKRLEKQQCLVQGMTIHARLKERGFEPNLVVATTLVDMYSKCGSMRRAQDVFDRMPYRNVVSWSSLILGYVENGQCYIALNLFVSMDCEPNNVTFAAVLKACASVAGLEQERKLFWLEKGVSLHKQLRELGFESDIVVANALLDMYRKCGRMPSARRVFDRIPTRNVVAWNCLLVGLVENGDSDKAMELFELMDCKPDCITYLAVIKACACMATEKEPHKMFLLEKVEAIHKQVEERGFLFDLSVANSLLDIYSKCRNMSRATSLFMQLPARNVVTWNCLILGLVDNEESLTALDMFTSMDCEPDYLTFVAALKACGELASLPFGRVVHRRLLKAGLEQVQVVANSLVDFYCRCSNVTAAEALFSGMESPTVVSWTTLIAGYSSLGDTSRVFTLLEEMEEAGLQPDGVVFTIILGACSHAGKVDEGKKFFVSMSRYGVTPNADHYNVLVDMLGRANRLEEAVSVVRGVEFLADDVTWMTLLGASRKSKDLEVGKLAFQLLS